ncbi:actin-binding protein IPP [Lates japonicus]|uniref:Actin-binding protein IPP n=1 Tax=Lates japonicus TaxID=270547 RepID=A0AAD3NJB4_LATJO|nr:actin-binding protein IPP [Lates japonicus]
MLQQLPWQPKGSEQALLASDRYARLILAQIEQIGSFYDFCGSRAEGGFPEIFRVHRLVLPPSSPFLCLVLWGMRSEFRAGEGSVGGGCCFRSEELRIEDEYQARSGVRLQSGGMIYVVGGEMVEVADVHYPVQASVSAVNGLLALGAGAQRLPALSGSETLANLPALTGHLDQSRQHDHQHAVMEAGCALRHRNVQIQTMLFISALDHPKPA